MPTPAALIAALVTGAGLAWISIPHCFGMCGALHLTVSCIHSERPIRALSLFNLGRIVGYTILGGLAGGAGFLINKAGVSCCGNATSPPIFSALIPAIMFLALAIGALRKRGVGGTVTPLLKKLLGKVGLFTSGCAAALLPWQPARNASAKTSGERSREERRRQGRSPPRPGGRGSRWRSRW